MGDSLALHALTRRHFFRNCSVGLGTIALASLLTDRVAGRCEAGPGSQAPATGDLPRPHFPPRAKSVIYVFRAGGPSQLERCDYKAALQKLDGEMVPESV